MTTLTQRQRMATLYGQAFAVAGAILLDRLDQRNAAIVVGSVAFAAGFVTTMTLLHEDKDPPADMMRGVLVAMMAKAILILYAVWELTFDATS